MPVLKLISRVDLPTEISTAAERKACFRKVMKRILLIVGFVMIISVGSGWLLLPSYMSSRTYAAPVLLLVLALVFLILFLLIHPLSKRAFSYGKQRKYREETEAKWLLWLIRHSEPIRARR